jgi:hypothetical protein
MPSNKVLGSKKFPPNHNYREECNNRLLNIPSSVENTSNGSSGTDAKPDLTTNSSQKIQIFVWLHLESGQASNTKVIEDLLHFPEVINPLS